MKQKKWLWLAVLAIAMGLTACAEGDGGRDDTAAVAGTRDAKKPDSTGGISVLEAGSEDTWGTSPNQLEISPVPEYLFPKSSTQMIDCEDLYLFTLKELRFGRNEIYARHGKEFQSPELTEYFSGKNWYKEALAAGPFDESMLNETELANIKLLAAVEEERSNDLGPHAEEQANPYLIDETAPVDVIQEIEIFDEQCGRPSDFVKAEAAGLGGQSIYLL